MCLRRHRSDKCRAVLASLTERETVVLRLGRVLILNDAKGTMHCFHVGSELST
jgi:hypothetical protein